MAVGWALACVAVTVGLTGCSAKEDIKGKSQDFVIDTVKENAEALAPLGKANAEKIAELSADLTKQDAEMARLQTSLDVKNVEVRALETARAQTQAKLDNALDRLATYQVEHEDDVNLAIVLIPGLFVSGLAGWALSARRADRRPQHNPKFPE